MITVSVRTLYVHEAGAAWLAASPFADCRDGMTAVTCAPPDGGPIVVPGVSAQPVDGACRRCCPERVHERVLRVFGHRDKGRHWVSAGGRVNALVVPVYPSQVWT
jgi:hypothetical protein